MTGLPVPPPGVHTDTPPPGWGIGALAHWTIGNHHHAVIRLGIHKTTGERWVEIGHRPGALMPRLAPHQLANLANAINIAERWLSEDPGPHGQRALFEEATNAT